jgi:hypothetical protein
MIQLRYQQPSLWGGFWAEEVADLWEPWMREADRLLADGRCWIRFTKRRGNGRKHIESEAGNRRPPKWYCGC